MPRSHSETENVQFVQDLAEVDGPFESPININFKDLTKLELPALVWNRSEVCPKKMKIANTGHTVIVSGKWKSERPYLSGGPLVGNYVFSQIHFHWGQEDCKGSEHLVGGEGFPLEMHVAHFKSDYLTQESALREKDGMVVLVYLFKIQEEPNTNMKKILSMLPSIKEAGSSQSLDPRPILCWCNPFTDDYFMYWGSVVTSTCAHILLWLVCREPFGISKDQVSEFRKILDSSQQPIYRNNRETQPLHKRNVFHVNASKNLDSPMLGIKKIVGCFCGRGMEDRERSPSRKYCSCPGSTMNQEDVEGTATPCGNTKHPKQGMNVHHQTVFVQRATVHSAPLLPKALENTYFGQMWPGNGGRPIGPDGQSKLVSKSCCFISLQELKDRKSRPEARRKKRQKSLDSTTALSNIMASLEALKNQTFKKLREIDLINREIKGMKNYCQKTNEKKWLRKVEKIMTRQKELTIKSSQGCLTELKKLARECKVDQFFNGKLISMRESDKLKKVGKTQENRVLPYSMEVGTIENPQISPEPKALMIGKAIKFSARAQKLIRSFFEDIQETEEFHKTLKSDLNSKIHLISHKSEKTKNSSSTSCLRKGFITKKMFALGNLGDRFFTEVTPDDAKGEEEEEEEDDDGDDDEYEEEEAEENYFTEEGESTRKKLFVSLEVDPTEISKETTDSDLITKETSEEGDVATSRVKEEDIFPLHRVNVAVENVKNGKENQALERPLTKENDGEVLLFDEAINFPSISSAGSHANVESDRSNDDSPSMETDSPKKKSVDDSEELISGVRKSSSNDSTDSTETQRMIIAKFHKKSKKNEIFNRRSSLISKLSSTKGLFKNSKSSKKRRRFRNVNFEGYYIKRKSVKGKSKRIQKSKAGLKRTESSCDLSSISKEDLRWIKRKVKWKHMTKTRFKLKIEKTSDSTTESAIEFSLLRSSNPKRIKFKSGKKSGRNGEFKKGVDSPATKKSSPGRREKSAVENQTKEHSDPRYARWEGKEEKQAIGIQEKTTESFDKNEKVGGDTPRSEHDSRQENSSSGEIFKRSGSASSRDSNSSCQNQPENESFPEETKAVESNCLEMFKKKVNHKSNDENGEKGNEILEPERKLEIVRRYGATTHGKAKNSLNKGASLESYQAEEKLKLKSQYGQKRQIQNVQEFEIRFVTTPKQLFSENLTHFPQLEQGTGIAAKSTSARCDIEKYHFLEKELKEVETTAPQNESAHREKATTEKEVKKSDSENSIQSILAPGVKEDSVSCGKTKTNSNGGPRPVENSSSLTKRPKGRSKKRANNCKRMSRHYSRKNFCLLKRPNKVDGKPIQFLSLSNEEQLKIISAKVAKYIREKLEERKRNFDLESEKREEETRRNPVENPAKEKRRDSPTTAKETKKKQEENRSSPRSTKKIKGSHRREENAEGKTKGKLNEVPTKEMEKKSTPTKPPLNFIKLNKLMAGKYKKTTSPPKEIKTKIPILQSKQKESKLTVQKKVKGDKTSGVTKDPEETETVPKAVENINGQQQNRKSPVRKNNGNSKTDSNSRKKFEFEKRKAKKPNSASGEKNPESKMNESGENISEESESIPVESSTSLVPAYLLNTMLSTGADGTAISDQQRQQMNQFLLNVKTKAIDSHLSDSVYERVKYYESKSEHRESAFAKDLENLIRLQMCLNNEIAANIENSMNYIKTLLGQDCKGSAIVEKAPMSDKVDSLGRGQSGVVLIEMDDIMDWSSSSSDYWEETEMFNYLDVAKGKTIIQSKEIAEAEVKNVPKESGDSKLFESVVFGREPESEYNSDSSYNCEISITLNGSSNELDDQKIKRRQIGCYSKERFNNPWSHLLGRKSNLSHIGPDRENFKGVGVCESSSRSLVFKPVRKKRKENEISIEMKRKLLEILEGEIRREMALNCSVGSSDNSSDVLPLKWEEGNGTGTSQSGESGSDNAEVIAQISETMRQYLREYKTRRYVKKTGNTLVKSKPEEEEEEEEEEEDES